MDDEITPHQQGYDFSDGWNKKVELFDLSRDLSESNDLSDQMKDKARELDGLLTRYLDEVGAETRRTQKT